MKVTPLSLPEVLLIEPRVFPDNRGHFLEVFQDRRYLEHGVSGPFVQDNLSVSKKGVLRGLHYQLKNPQGKLVMAMAGEVFDVVVDIRRGSPRFGRFAAVTLSAENCRQLYIPPGFAHGICIVSETAAFLYKCTDYYQPGDEYGIRWDDPDLGIPWPIVEPLLSDRDRDFPALKEAPPEHLPVYQPPA